MLVAKKSVSDNALSTDQEMIPATNAIYARAQGFVAYGDLVLPTLKVFAQCIHSQYVTINI